MERVMEQSVEEKEEVKGTSREPGTLAGVYEVLSQRAIDEAIRISGETPGRGQKGADKGKIYPETAQHTPVAGKLPESERACEWCSI